MAFGAIGFAGQGNTPIGRTSFTQTFSGTAAVAAVKKQTPPEARDPVPPPVGIGWVLRGPIINAAIGFLRPRGHGLCDQCNMFCDLSLSQLESTLEDFCEGACAGRGGSYSGHSWDPTDCSFTCNCIRNT